MLKTLSKRLISMNALVIILPRLPSHLPAALLKQLIAFNQPIQFYETQNRTTPVLKRVKNKSNQQKGKGVFASPLFMLVVISLKLPYKQPKKLLARIRLHIKMLDGNPFFPTTNPTLAAFTAFALELEDTITQIEAGNKALIPHRKTLELQGLEMLRLLAYNLQAQSKGDEEQVKSSGYEIRKFGGPGHPIGQVLNLRAKPVGEGIIKLRWLSERIHRMYYIEQLIAGKWKAIGKTRNISFKVKNLVPGELYHFRVYATNGNEDGNPSDLVEQRSL
jgi:hypothetical protein